MNELLRVPGLTPFRTEIVGVCREDQSSGKTCKSIRSDPFLQCRALCDLLQYMCSCPARDVVVAASWSTTRSTAYGVYTLRNLSRTGFNF
ncbi:Uncharacterized protein APZ42_032966 [Daphnia magna]|uniref:Uncharacterized protein n=1 Tax=Daphnia magna TaxID=35525 RepID=A0A164LI90_9CRUS|nr:Uncharacterized protein APZ42_032966 [Daphnia magna]